jgi:histidinol-phosphate phosphatase family protein
VFLDRDGTIIEDRGYTRLASDVALLPGVADALARFHEAGFRLVVVSNQSGVARGLISPNELEQVHARVLAILKSKGIQLDGAYYCTHAPWDGCPCRKPMPALFFKAAEELDLDLPRSFAVGDSVSDAQAGEAAGCRTILLKPGSAAKPEDCSRSQVAASWHQVAELVLHDSDG